MCFELWLRIIMPCKEKLEMILLFIAMIKSKYITLFVGWKGYYMGQNYITLDFGVIHW